MQEHSQESIKDKPWLSLTRLIDNEDVDAINAYLNSMSPSETARAVSRIDKEASQKLLTLLGSKDAAEMLLDLPDEQVADLVEEIKPQQAAGIINAMPQNEQVDILADVQDESAQAILAVMPKEKAKQARQLLEYSEDSAGGIMITDFLAYEDNMTVEQVLYDLRTHREIYLDYNVQYVYVVDQAGKLKGVLRMRDFLLSKLDLMLRDVMIQDPVFVEAQTSLDDLIGLFEEQHFLGVPVVDKNQNLIGVVRRGEVMEAEGERDKESYLKASGIVGGEELRSMPWWERSHRRLSWLSINIVLNVIAASVIAMYQDTLSAVIALAVFLPIISDMSGCSGNQAVAVSIRELAMGLIKPHELFRVFLKEMSIGLVNGLILGVLLGAVAYFWQDNFYLGVVVGGALAVNTIVAVCLGGLIPLVLKGMKKDPALASGPILTTVTDMCGFLLALSFATTFLSKITS